jgi:nucleotide-binding universal stress UspA family protein
MSYKTILVHVDESTHARERIEVAARLAITESAHLIGTAASGAMPGIYSGSLPDFGPTLQAHLKRLRERAEDSLQAFENTARAIGVPSYEKRIIDDEVGAGICLQARYADLLVLGQEDPDEATALVPADFPQYVVLNCTRPVLIVPYTGHFDTLGERVLIAWDASMQATRAITHAIPMLRRAQMVHIAMFNPVPEAHGELPGASIALYLARHGVKVEVVQRKVDIDIGAALLSMAADENCDLIVMGAYAHSRFRQIMLGGVTHTILDTMTVPVMMSH